ncbi:VOC family protein [Ensifer sp.]|uniref:VOC family protein n=1 Tax=Ensifer sp. TaxID=1872086 RepID=UPI002E121FBB|nr:VOC family protein [Ensifer sp.]
MPNLENLKKQAKQYLKWHREGHYPVAATIRSGLPRFLSLDDDAILKAEFKLADAQELVARQSGFDSWQALKSGAPAMTAPSRPTASQPVLQSTAAQLFVADIRAACDFYCDKLGFAVDFVYGEPPFYGQVARDHACLALRLVCEPVFVAGIREREHLLAASIGLNSASDIKQLFLSYQAAGVRFHQPLRTEPWGTRTFIVHDPDGNLVLFAGPGD